MQSVGIRELRQRASDVLRRVEAGETFEVTDRGRPVALLTPVPSGGPLERLRAAGELSSITGDLSDFPEGLPVPAGSLSASEILARLREDER